MATLTADQIIKIFNALKKDPSQLLAPNDVNTFDYRLVSDIFSPAIRGSLIDLFDQPGTQGYTPLDVLCDFPESHSVLNTFWACVRHNDRAIEKLRTALLQRCAAPDNDHVPASLRAMRGIPLLMILLSQDLDSNHDYCKQLRIILETLYPKDAIDTLSPTNKVAFIAALCPTRSIEHNSETILHRLLRLNLSPHIFYALSTPDTINSIINDDTVFQRFILALSAVNSTPLNLSVPTPGQTRAYDDYRRIKDTSALALLIAGRDPGQTDPSGREIRAFIFNGLIKVPGFLEKLCNNTLCFRAFMHALNCKPSFPSTHSYAEPYASLWHAFVYFPSAEKTAALNTLLENAHFLAAFKDRKKTAPTTLDNVGRAVKTLTLWTQADPTRTFAEMLPLSDFAEALAKIVTSQQTAKKRPHTLFADSDDDAEEGPKTKKADTGEGKHAARPKT